MSSNKDVIYSIVKEYFSLEEESLKIFKDRLYNPIIDDIYKSFGLDENHRKYWSLSGMEESLDDGWRMFNDRFPTFIKEYNVTYKDFKENKVTIDKNRVKIMKALVNFYSLTKERLNNNSFTFESRDLENISGHINSIKELERENNAFSSYMRSRGSFSPSETSDKSLYLEYLENLIRCIMEAIGVHRLPKSDNLYLVLSCNFEDWFFCSTSNGWSSCLSLDSSYPYWSGLPGIINDSNRAILYLTDKEQKNPVSYINKEIKLDKMLSRTWVLLSSKGSIEAVRFYPSRILSVRKINMVTGSTLFEKLSEGVHPKTSKNSFEMLYHEGGMSSYIYQDNTRLFVDKIEKENPLFKIESGGCGIQYYMKDECDFVSQDMIQNISSGLYTLYKSNKSIKNYIRENANCEYMCDNCNEEIHGDDYYISPRDSILCEECFFESYEICSDCGETYRIEDTVFVEQIDESLCTSCFDNSFSYCHDCGNIESYDDFIEVNGNLVCEDCLSGPLYEDCCECEETFRAEDVIYRKYNSYCVNCLAVILKEEKQFEEKNDSDKQKAI